MQIFPVLDLMDGQVVRGVAGQRDLYRPVESILTASSEPLAVAEAFREKLGLSQFYIADLDGIRFGQPQHAILDTLSQAFPGMWLDCGIRTPPDVPAFLSDRETVFVLGLETIAGPHVMTELCKDWGIQRIAFSLDLKNGKPLGNLGRWRSDSAFEIAAEAIALGVTNLIVLDLAQVGTSEGASTLPLCRRIKQEFPEVQIVTGGGIRDARDLFSLKACPVDGALVASAFHRGAIGLADLMSFDNQVR